jgi:hypothetical protein
MVKDEELVVIGPFGDCIRLETDEPAYLVTEIDGARAITATTSFMVQKVPSKFTFLIVRTMIDEIRCI